ncbi:MAG: DUF3634 family protein [Myxococcales bacterium]|nr:MAG: DUF3634 family protein [Myxococcales bacterium]
MAQARGQLGLGDEQLGKCRARGQLGQHLLDDHEASGPELAALARQEDLGHAPAPDAVEQRVGAEGPGQRRVGGRGRGRREHERANACGAATASGQAPAPVASDTLLTLLLLVVVLVVPFVVLLRRANELFVLEVRGGQITVVRGKPPASLLRDLRDVVRGVPAARLVARREQGRPMLRATGLSEAQLQRARNVVGRFAGARIGRG